MKRPTLQDIKEVLEEYEEPYLTPWAEWLYENWHRELPRLRITIFNNLVDRLANKHGFPLVNQWLRQE